MAETNGVNYNIKRSLSGDDARMEMSSTTRYLEPRGAEEQGLAQFWS